MTERALVLLPTYNEKDNIEKISRQVIAIDPRIEVLIVDDNSPDGTGQIADRLAAENPRIKVLHRTGKQGLGRAYIAGFHYGIEKKYDYIFEMDADFSHQPKYLADHLKNIETCDISLGSRYIKGGGIENWPKMRWAISYYANVYSRVVTGLPVRDATGGFKCFRRRVLESLDLDSIRSNGYSFQIEVSFRAWLHGFKIQETPIVFVEREAGHSKFSKKIIYEAVFMVLYLGVQSIPFRVKRLFSFGKK
ncbi:MAG: polyprenol monophosphomannose synthase [candidate division Zixibacteria bacterium]|nr:polyprenol monophosphomannose synthase [candidate division Zixibacteria bacterium]